MRIRTVKPGFWNDEKLVGLPGETRLIFIGLWMESDDAGLFEWRPKAIAADLFPFHPGKRREQKVERALAELAGIAAIRRLDCGRHGIVENLLRHQHLSGRTTKPVERDHIGRCLADKRRASASIREHPRASAAIGEGKEGKGKEGNIYTRASARETTNGAEPEGEAIVNPEDEEANRRLAMDATAPLYVREAAYKALERAGSDLSEIEVPARKRWEPKTANDAELPAG